MLRASDSFTNVSENLSPQARSRSGPLESRRYNGQHAEVTCRPFDTKSSGCIHLSSEALWEKEPAW